MNKLELLKELRKEIDFTVKGLENYPTDAPSLIIANHNCLMDIFYLPAALPEATISFISPRLMYKPLRERKEKVEKYLYAMPIEAHGGSAYSTLCLNEATSLLKEGMSASLFPEGAYIPEKDKIHRGRTGMSRILFDCKKKGLKVYLLPVSIKIENPFHDLDSFVPNGEKVTIQILKPIDYEQDFEQFRIAQDQEKKREILHQTADKTMTAIAQSLQKPYCLEYIELRPKGNVMFQDGTTVPTSIAVKENYLNTYQQELKDRSNKIVKQLSLYKPKR